MTGGEGAGGLLAEAVVAVSVHRPDIRDDVLGGNPAGEAAVETGRRWALDEPGTRASCEIDMFSPGSPADDAKCEVTLCVTPVSLRRCTINARSRSH